MSAPAQVSLKGYSGEAHPSTVAIPCEVVLTWSALLVLYWTLCWHETHCAVACFQFEYPHGHHSAGRTQLASDTSAHGRRDPQLLHTATTRTSGQCTLRSVQRWRWHAHTHQHTHSLHGKTSGNYVTMNCYVHMHKCLHAQIAHEPTYAGSASCTKEHMHINTQIHTQTHKYTHIENQYTITNTNANTHTHTITITTSKP